MSQIGEVKHGRDLGKKQLRVKYIWLPCKLCGKERWVQYYHQANMCADCQLKKLHSQLGRKNPSWVGGRTVDKSRGYVWILLCKNDFFYPMVQHGERVYEHRLVMAKHLNRCLLPWEVVHHKNGIKGDNRIENLELLTGLGKHNTILNKYINKLLSENRKLRGKLEELECLRKS